VGATAVSLKDLPGARRRQIGDVHARQVDAHCRQRGEGFGRETASDAGKHPDLASGFGSEGHSPGGLCTATAKRAHLCPAIRKHDVVDDNARRKVVDGHARSICSFNML